MDDSNEDKNGMLADFQVFVHCIIYVFVYKGRCFVIYLCFCVIQAITGIDNTGEALMHLSNCNWDLLVFTIVSYQYVWTLFLYSVCIVVFQAAVQRVTPQHTQHLPSEGRSSLPNPPPLVTIADDFIMTASTSNENHRLLTIEIEQDGHSLTTLKMNDGSTLGNYLIL